MKRVVIQTILAVGLVLFAESSSVLIAQGLRPDRSTPYPRKRATPTPTPTPTPTAAPTATPAKAVPATSAAPKAVAAPASTPPKAVAVTPTPKAWFSATPIIAPTPVTPTPTPTPTATPPPKAAVKSKPPLQGFVAKNKDGDPAVKFFAGAPKIFVFWKGTALKTGDRVRVLWIAEDIGYIGRRDRKITEGATTAYKPDDDGAFSLTRPEGGWPVGKYRVDLFVGAKLAEQLRFTIEPDVTVEVR